MDTSTVPLVSVFRAYSSCCGAGTKRRPNEPYTCKACGKPVQLVNILEGSPFYKMFRAAIALRKKNLLDDEQLLTIQKMIVTGEELPTQLTGYTYSVEDLSVE